MPSKKVNCPSCAGHGVVNGDPHRGACRQCGGIGNVSPDGPPRPITHFVVLGRYPFPMDMLRYDCCWPRDSESAAEIAASHSYMREPRAIYRVRLSTAAPVRTTPDRWRSFGWVIEQGPRTEAEAKAMPQEIRTTEEEDDHD